MTAYERLDDAGSVVEIVSPVPGSYEDTRLGVAVLEGSGGWRVQGADTPPSPAPPEPSAEPGPDEATKPQDKPKPRAPKGGGAGTAEQ